MAVDAACCDGRFFILNDRGVLVIPDIRANAGHAHLTKCG
jgi:hypothetical protein